MALCTIVGVGPGIGLSVAKRFAENGFDIALIARNEEHLKNYSKTLKLYGTKVSYVIADAGKANELVKVLREFCEGTDVLVYNAGVVEKSSPDINSKKLLEDLSVNVVGGLISAQQVIPSMQKKGKGTIIFTGGGFAHEPDPDYTSLSIGKAGLLNMGIILAKQYEPSGIHVAVVSVHGKVKPKTKYAPDLIAEEFWKLHVEPKTEWQREVNIK